MAISALTWARGPGWIVSAVTGRIRAMRGLMQDSPLTIDTIFRHAEQHYGDMGTQLDRERDDQRAVHG